MKSIVMATLLALSSTAFASARIDVKAYSLNVASQAMVQSVIEKRLVSSEARRVLRAALKGEKANLGTLTCDRALGTDICTMDVYEHDDQATAEAEETLYQLEIRLKAGALASAELQLTAG